MYRVEIMAGRSAEWVGNGLRFDTVESAVAYARDRRWTAVIAWRVIDAGGNGCAMGVAHEAAPQVFPEFYDKGSDAIN